MKTIYVIMTGEYSDTSVYGYMENEEDAYRYCIVRNREDGYSEYWVQETDLLEAEIEPFTLHKQHSIYFDIMDGKPHLRKGEYLESFEYYEGKKRGDVFDEYARNLAVVLVSSTKDRKRAERKAIEIANANFDKENMMWL